MPKAPSGPQADLAVADGPAIVRTKATEKYRLGASDLDSILPVSLRPRGQTCIREYNVKDVEALDARLNSDLPLPSERAAQNGAQIKSFAAMTRFKLRPAQLQRVRPVSVENVVGKKPTSVYNLCDIEALAGSITAAALPAALVSVPANTAPVASSSTNPGTSTAASHRGNTGINGRHARARRPVISAQVEDDYDYMNEPNIFDNMTRDEADYFMAGLWHRNGQ